jgi:tetratricopeptide (TPR) repeat protein
LNPVEKAALKILYGGIPKATIEESISYYESAKRINPNFLLNYLELSKAYVENHQSDKAIEVLNRMLKLPNKTANDPLLKDEARKYLQTLL